MKRDIAPLAGWTYVGCVNESYNQRLLEGFSFISESLTPLMCLDQCSKLGYAMGATEYADEVGRILEKLDLN